MGDNGNRVIYQEAPVVIRAGEDDGGSSMVAVERQHHGQS